MKATGIVRRIDDLGRVVIPKEIRRTMRIREGDPLEIFTDKDGEVIFKKYSPMNELGDFSAQICDSLSKTTNRCVAVCDRDTIIAVSGAPKRELFGKQISADLDSIIGDRQIVKLTAAASPVALSSSTDKYHVSIAAPIVAGGDIMGCIVFFTEDMCELGEVEYKLAQTVASFLGKQLED